MSASPRTLVRPKQAHRCLCRLSGIALLATCIALADPTRLPAQATVARSPALLPFLGAGGFPRPRDVESGAVDAGQVLLGAAVELPSRASVVLLSWAPGIQPVGCPGGCAPEGMTAEATLSMHVLRGYDDRAAFSLGPVFGYSTFDGRRGTFGAAASVGATRGIGPRFLLRYAVLSGPGRPRSLAGWLGIRLGA